MSNEVNSPMPRGEADAFDTRLYLREEELDRGVGLLLAAERRLAEAGEAARRAADLSRGDLQILLALRYRPGQSVSELRTRLGATTPTLARLLAGLDRRGLIRRDAARSDARRRELTLTAQGEALTAPVAAAMRDALRAAYRDAGPQQVAGARAVLDALVK